MLLQNRTKTVRTPKPKEVSDSRIPKEQIVCVIQSSLLLPQSKEPKQAIGKYEAIKEKHDKTGQTIQKEVLCFNV